MPCNQILSDDLMMDRRKESPIKQKNELETTFYHFSVSPALLNSLETEQETSADRCLTADLHVSSMTLNNTILAHGADVKKPHFMTKKVKSTASFHD